MAEKHNPEDATTRFHEQRVTFTKLLATNPNYFGTLPDFPLEPEVEINDTHRVYAPGYTGSTR